jgi:UDP-glucose 4-epimerase
MSGVGRVLVTGAGGFVGRWTVAELVARGHEVVAGYHAVQPDVPGAASALPLAVECFDDLVDQIRAVRVDAIVHAAAVAAQTDADLRPLGAIAVNALGTAHVLEAARVLGVARVLVVSSGAVYGPATSGPLREDRPFTRAGGGMYGTTKLAAELITAQYRQYGLDCVSVRTSRVFGPGPGGTDFLIDTLVRQCLAGGPLLLGPAAAVPVDYTYVRDFGRAVSRLLEAGPLRHDAYNVSGGRGVTGFAIAKALQRIRPGVTWRRVPADPGSTFPYARPPFAIRRMAEELGWSPSFSLEDSLRDYLALAE